MVYTRRPSARPYLKNLNPTNRPYSYHSSQPGATQAAMPLALQGDERHGPHRDILDVIAAIPATNFKGEILWDSD
jgi:hypothetical protein